MESNKSTAKHKIRNKIFIILAFLCLIALLYIYWAQQLYNLLIPSDYQYYTLLLDAFFHARLNLHPIWATQDLSLYQNKWYLYYGPAPVLYILPFYLISHLQTSDRIYTLIAGILNTILFYFLMQQFQKYFKISLSITAELFLLLNFAFVSPNFALSLIAGTAFASQVIATLYLLIFFLCYFIFLNTEKLHWFIIATLLFYLAVLSRYDLIFNGLIFLYFFIHYQQYKKKFPSKIITWFCVITIAFASLLGTYNYLRFGSILELGHKYHQSAPRYAGIVKQGKTFSITYIPYNFFYYFLNIIHFTQDKRPVIVDTEGNSIFSVYPALLLLPVLFYNRKWLNKQRLAFLTIAGSIAMLSVFFLLSYFATGWMQFGIRYFLDITPILFLLLIFVLSYIPNSILLTILGYGIFVNVLGTLAMQGK